MATSWQTIIREVSKHANAFKSGDAATVSADYLTSPLTTTQVKDPYFSLDFIQDKCIDAHGRLALEIANVRAHPWRADIGNSLTAALASGDALPLVAANSKQIVGAWGQVNAGGVNCTEAAPERVRAALLSTFADPPLYTHPYLYYMDGGYIYHTETTVTVNCCTYERADVVANVPSGDISIPDVLVDALVAGAVAELIIEAKGIEQAGYFLSIFKDAIASIRQGQTTMPMMTLKATA